MVVVVAFVLLFAIAFFKVVGMASFDAKTLKEQGEPLQARLRMAFAWSLALAMVFALVGIWTNFLLFRVLGGVCVCATIPILFTRYHVARKRSNQKSK
jgi:hypothetical protein